MDFAFWPTVAAIYIALYVVRLRVDAVFVRRMLSAMSEDEYERDFALAPGMPRHRAGNLIIAGMAIANIFGLPFLLIRERWSFFNAAYDRQISKDAVKNRRKR